MGTAARQESPRNAQFSLDAIPSHYRRATTRRLWMQCSEPVPSHDSCSFPQIASQRLIGRTAAVFPEGRHENSPGCSKAQAWVSIPIMFLRPVGPHLGFTLTKYCVHANANIPYSALPNDTALKTLRASRLPGCPLCVELIGLPLPPIVEPAHNEVRTVVHRRVGIIR